MKSRSEPRSTPAERFSGQTQDPHAMYDKAGRTADHPFRDKVNRDIVGTVVGAVTSTTNPAEPPVVRVLAALEPWFSQQASVAGQGKRLSVKDVSEACRGIPDPALHILRWWAAKSANRKDIVKQLRDVLSPSSNDMQQAAPYSRRLSIFNTSDTYCRYPSRGAVLPMQVLALMLSESEFSQFSDEFAGLGAYQKSLDEHHRAIEQKKQNEALCARRAEKMKNIDLEQSCLKIAELQLASLDLSKPADTARKPSLERWADTERFVDSQRQLLIDAGVSTYRQLGALCDLLTPAGSTSTARTIVNQLELLRVLRAEFMDDKPEQAKKGGGK